MTPTPQAVAEATEALQDVLKEAPVPLGRVLRAIYELALEKSPTIDDALQQNWMSFTLNAVVAKAISSAERDGKTLDAGVVKGRVLELTRAFGDRSFGRFFVGRRGKKTRYVLWPDDNEEDAAMVAAIWKWAAGIIEDPSEQLPKPSMVDTLEHAFQLRPGLAVKIQLPADLSKTEATRFARFVESLPFDIA
jgi:hypothetical protein